MRPLTRRIAAAAGLFLLIATVYWKLLFFPFRFVWFDHYDLTELQIPRLQFFARSLHAGHFPLWNPYIWLGQPMLGSGQPGPLNPLVILFAWLLPLRDGLLSFAELNWLYVALHFLAALFAYRFCRYLELSVLPSLMGAVAFSCTGFLGSAAWLDITSAVALTPLVFYFAFRLWTEDGIVKHAAPLGLVLGLSWWTGHHEIPMILCYAVLFGSAFAAFGRFGQVVHVIRGTLLAFALAIPISAIQTLPFYEFGHASLRWVGVANPIGWADRVPYEVHARYSLPWMGLAEFFAPGGAPEEHWTAFAGVTVLVLAVAALIYRWSDRRVRMLGFLTLGSLLYALGANTPLHRLMYALLPLMEKARSPGRGIFLAGFALSALAAVGADLLIRGLIPRKGILIPVAAALAMLGVYWSGQVPEMEFPVRGHFVAKGMIAAAVLGVLMWRKFAVWPGFVLVALVVIEAGTVAAHRMTDLNSAVVATSLRKYGDLAKTLPRSGQGRIISDYNSLYTDLGDLYGVDVLQSFVSAVPENVLRFDFGNPRTQQLLGVTSVPGAMPRTWIVHHAIAAKDVDELRRLIQDPSVDFAATAVSLVVLPQLEECSDAGVWSFDRPDSDTMRLNADMRCRGLLVVSETFYPGWEAYVDGKPQPIYEVFGALRGVVLDAGNHRVEMRYRPGVVVLGTALSFSAILVSLLLMGAPALTRRGIISGSIHRRRPGPGPS